MSMLGSNPLRFTPAIPLGLIGFSISGTVQAAVSTGMIPDDGATVESTSLLAAWILLFAGILAYFDDFHREALFYVTFGILQGTLFVTALLSEIASANGKVIPPSANVVAGTLVVLVLIIIFTIPFSLWFTTRSNPSIRFERSLVGLLGLGFLIFVVIFLIFFAIALYVAGTNGRITDFPARSYLFISGVFQFMAVACALTLLWFQLARIISDKFVDVPLGSYHPPPPPEEPPVPTLMAEEPRVRLPRGFIWQEAEGSPVWEERERGSWATTRLARASTRQQSFIALAGLFPYPEGAPRIESVRRASLPREYMRVWTDDPTVTTPQSLRGIPSVSAASTTADDQMRLSRSMNVEEEDDISQVDSGVPLADITTSASVSPDLVQ